MRIVIDLQPCQGKSRNRGIGRYSLELTKAMARLSGKNELVITLSDAFRESLDDILRTFQDCLPRENIKIWHAIPNTAQTNSENFWRTQAAEKLWSHFVHAQRPDVLHISSLFEGFDDDVVVLGDLPQVTGITSQTMYDLIPMEQPEAYLPTPQAKRWYYRRLQQTKQMDLVLAISEFTRTTAIDALGLDPNSVVNISAAADARFRPIDILAEKKLKIRRKYAIRDRFVLSAATFEPRKNIEAMVKGFGRLPHDLRRGLQLVLLTGSLPIDRAQIDKWCEQAGCAPTDVILTGFLSNDDLVALYNLCELFVFPSLAEGFGLPVLEAMACGAPVVASNCSSIPEILGRKDNLFDPKSVTTISKAMAEVLGNRGFRDVLVEWGVKRASAFSWEESARRVWTAFESVSPENKVRRSVMRPFSDAKPRLAYFSPLPPEKTGIADFSADLLPDLAKYYDIDIIVKQETADSDWLSANFSILRVEDFVQRGAHYDRIVYNFGNSPFHEYMFATLQAWPGVVILHDFFLGHVLNYFELIDIKRNDFKLALLKSHGFEALQTLLREGDTNAAVRYPANAWVLNNALGVLVHSQHAIELTREWYGENAARELCFVHQPVNLMRNPGRAEARLALGIKDDQFFVCSFGFVAATKLFDRLLNAWKDTALHHDGKGQLVFVGEDGHQDVARYVTRAGIKRRSVKTTGYVNRDLFSIYLAACDLAVQLRAGSRGETSRSVLECFAAGLPTITNAHGSASELPDNIALILPDDFSDAHLTESIDRLSRDPHQRSELKEKALRYIREDRLPSVVAARYADAIEALYADPKRGGRSTVLRDIAGIRNGAATTQDLLVTASAYTSNFVRRIPRGLFIDVTAIYQEDLKTGIQRVVKEISKRLLRHCPPGYRVELVVYREGRFVFARDYSCSLLGISDDGVARHETVDWHRGDVFLGLDWTLQWYPEILEKIRALGVAVYFVVYDILPVLRSEFFPPELVSRFREWLIGLLSVSDGLVGISKSVAKEIATFAPQIRTGLPRTVKLGFFHLGADFEAHSESRSGEKRYPERPVFLMVGTVEPRKGYVQAIKAFESLWEAGVDAKLVIVGKKGWMVDAFTRDLDKHAENGQKLIWLKSATDKELATLYRECDALIIASEGEGFGLPIVEAALAKLPIIARDIPVFREIAGENAIYFSGSDPDNLSEAIETWLKLRETSSLPDSGAIRVSSWDDSTRELRRVILNGDWSFELQETAATVSSSEI